MEKIRLILVDDHELIRQGVRRSLERFPHLQVVGEAGDGEGALELVKTSQPDVMVLDIRMPKLNGVGVLNLTKELSPKTKTLVLSAYDDDDYVLTLMEAGANGYLLKTSSSKDLAEAIQRVYTGEAVLDPNIAAKVARLWSRYADMAKSDRDEPLSAREREVLELSARGLRNKGIADALGISVRTVEGHFNRIFAKLNVSSRMEAVICAAAIGVITMTDTARGETKP